MIKSPLRIQRFVPVLALALVGLAACGSSTAVTSPNDIFAVNGTSYSKADFEQLTKDLVAAGQVKMSNGQMSTEEAQSIIKTLIRFESFNAMIKERGISIDDADRTKVVEQSKSDPTFTTYPQSLQDLLIELNVAGTTLAKVSPPKESDLRELYEAAPAKSGTLCLSHILVKTEAEARAVLADLDKGVDFATEAGAKSIEPGAKKSGGALKNGDEPCIALSELQVSFDKAFLAGAVLAKAGVPTGPVKSSFGFHIILSHPFDDVKDSVSRIVAKDPGNTLLAGYMTQAKISVNSAYGRWNTALSTFE